MHERTMITFRVILEDQFPIRAHVVLNAFCRTQFRQVPMAEFARQRGENRFQWNWVFREIQEDESFPEAGVNFVQWIRRFIKSFALLHLWRTQKPPIKTICPCMVGALNGLAKMAFVFFAKSRPAVAASVIKGTNLAELIAN